MIEEDYDLRLIVTPHLTSSLPLIATVAGGPIAGAVTWVVNKALGPGVNKMTRYEYLIKGSWQEPTIEPVRSPMKRLSITNKTQHAT